MKLQDTLMDWEVRFYIGDHDETKADSSTQQLACLGCPVDMDEEAEAEGEEPDDLGDEDDA